ncbi:MAG TPA: L,D-transpeptidase [Xanthobacteraceae bacterium]|nr:L,D-transpeptidase [Xanthobacteraceae bacterium]
MSAIHRTFVLSVGLLAGALALLPVSASAQTFGTPYAPQADLYAPQADQYAPQADQPGAADDALSSALRRQVVSYPTSEPPGTIVIDTPHTFLYLVLGGGKAMRYGIGVGRQGFTWSGTETIVRKAEWPDWYPPSEMVARQPYLPRFVAGGPGNPLGARAMYLGHTDYRIHGTNDPSSIGKHMSSGCIRLLNADVIDLYSRVGIGTKVVVLPNSERQASLGSRIASEEARGPAQPLSLRSSATASVY